MTKTKPPAQINKPEPHDPFKMRSLEQILILFDNGDFQEEVMRGNEKLMKDLLEHNQTHGSKGCAGSMTLTIDYTVGNAGDTKMGAKVTFKPPKKPSSSATAFINEDGELTLYNPMMKRMHEPVRDVSGYDTETGEIRDI